MLSLEVLQIFLYSVFAFSAIAYATLDGFDLGVGCLHLCAKNDEERRLVINAIGPVWDGNTTWIVIGSGVLFAAFPRAFSIAMSGLYTPLMAILFAFMLRGAAVEFRSKRYEMWWRKTWDFLFFFASLMLAVVFGLILGNLIQGVPLNKHGIIEGGVDLTHPYPILVACFALSIFMMHGSIYLLMKTEGPLHNRIRKWTKRLAALFLVLWVVTTVATLFYNRHMIRPILERPYLSIFALLSFASICAIFYCVKKHKDGLAFVSSCLSIAFLLILFIVGTFPHFVVSTLDPAFSLTLFNSSASHTALSVLALIVVLGMPLSFFYIPYLFKVFRGKVRLDPMSY